MVIKCCFEILSEVQWKLQAYNLRKGARMVT
jgi:hypothetical protein